MNLFKTSVVTLVFLIGAFFPQQSAQESAELKEAATLTESVEKLAKEGKYNEALPLAKRALEIRQRLLPGNDPLIATSLSYVADLQAAEQNWGAAKNALQQILQHLEARVGPEDPGVARVLERLGLIYLNEGDFGKAEDHYKRALQIKEKALGADNAQLAQTLVGLATVYRARRDFDRGAPLFKRALTIYGQHSGVNSRAFDEAGIGFSCLAHETGNRDAVKDLNEIWKRFAPADSQTESPYTQLNAKALSLPRPDYPMEARTRRVSGTVVIKVTIDENGRVINARDMCHGSPFLVPGSLTSARNARFSPATVSDKPVKVDGVITYRFVWQ